MKATFDLLKEPRGWDYRLLLDFCSSRATTALLVVREPDWLLPSATRILERLEPFCEKASRQSEWPGTRLTSDQATVYHYALCTESLSILKDSAEGLYDWVQPHRPEDLCLLRGDSPPILVTIAHERDAFLELTHDESEELLRMVPTLKIAKSEF